MAASVALAALVIASGLYPILSTAGRVVVKFNQQFLGEDTGPLKIPTFPVRSTIYAADGSILATPFLGENRRIVSLENVNQTTRNAVLAIEDHGFYEHGAVDVYSIIRAAFANLRAGTVVQGGSTLSQQLIKNLETGGEQTFARKIKEAQDAMRLERSYSKDQILETYLNVVYFGHGVYGLGTAAEYYFAKKATRLNLPESALLAGLIASPETWDPIAHPDSALARRNQVLRRMSSLGWITGAEYDQATAEPIELSATKRLGNSLGREAHWVKYVENQILHDDPAFKKILGKTYAQRRDALFQGGLKIYTTLQPSKQAGARAAVAAHLPTPGVAPPADPESAVVSLVPQTGAIQAMYSGPSFKKSQFDLASQGQRQTGSAFKAFTLAAAMERGIPPGKVYNSASPLTVPSAECPPSGWNVSNAEPGNGGYMNLWDATKYSVNVIFAQLIGDVGPTNVADTAERMGINRKVPAYCSLTLGSFEVTPLEMTSAYSTLANGGIHCRPFAITRVDSLEGKVLYRAKPKCDQVIPATVAHQVTAMLEGVVSGGTGWRANIGRPQAGKTGTNQAFRDAWFMGYVPQLATGVWVGYAKGQIEMRSVHGIEVFGGTFPAEIWHDFMLSAVQGLPWRDFPEPPPQRAGTVPDVVGLQQEDAKDALAEASFTAIASEVDSSEPAGTVVAQSPGGGTAAVLGSAVSISVSNGQGPPQAKVPDVVGLKKDKAVANLEAAGFAVDVRYKKVPDASQDGRVLSQKPDGGITANEGATVTITVGRQDSS
jgi:1A family penicillin-binding protein